jgi:lipid-A-disaccharide synthase
MAVFGKTLRLLREQGVDFELVLPTMPHLLDAVREGVASWQVAPRLAVGEQEKKAAFRIARAAFAKSGTVTLELALAGVPMIGAYRAGPIEMWIALALAKTSSVILANLVMGENVVPEFMQADATPEKLAPALRDVLQDTPQRRRQLQAFSRLDAIMATGSAPPSMRAADIVLATLREGRKAG